MTFAPRPWPILYRPADLVRGDLLVIAPHPDDEIISSSGLIAAHRDVGRRVVCAVVTDGARGDFKNDEGIDYVDLRRAESKEAGDVLGGVEYRFLGFPDGGFASVLANDEAHVIAVFRDLLRSSDWSTVVFPSPFEFHPDHRATAFALMRAAAEAPEGRWLAYEIGEMVPCNLLLDITAYRERKEKALQAFRSQIRHNDIVGKVEGLNRARTVNCDDPKILACEAYLRIDPARLLETLAAADAVTTIVDSMAPAPYV